MKGKDLLKFLQGLTPSELDLPVLVATPEYKLHVSRSVGWQNIRYGEDELTPALRKHAFPTGDESSDEYFVPLILIRSI